MILLEVRCDLTSVPIHSLSATRDPAVMSLLTPYGIVGDILLFVDSNGHVSELIVAPELLTAEKVIICNIIIKGN